MSTNVRVITLHASLNNNYLFPDKDMYQSFIRHIHSLIASYMLRDAQLWEPKS